MDGGFVSAVDERDRDAGPLPQLPEFALRPLAEVLSAQDDELGDAVRVQPDLDVVPVRALA
jgi:hypothetical protein